MARTVADREIFHALHAYAKICTTHRDCVSVISELEYT